MEKIKNLYFSTKISILNAIKNFPHKDLLINILITGICLFLCAANLDNDLHYGDSIQIIAQAKAFAENSVPEFVKNNSFIVENSDLSITSNTYCWGTSILIAPLFKIYGMYDVLPYKILLTLLYGLFISLLFIYSKPKVGSFYAAIITLLIGLNYYYANITNFTYKEIPFLFSIFLGAVFLEKMFKTENLKKKDTYSFVVFISLFLCFMFRENAIQIYLIFFVATIINIIIDIIKKQISVHKFITYIYPYITAPVLFHLVSIKYPIFYLDQPFNLNWRDLLFFTDYYIKEIYNEFFSFNIPIIFKTFYIIFIILFLIGLYKKIREEYVCALFVASFIESALFSSTQGIRYILFIIPFFLIFSVIGIITIKNKYIKIILTIISIIILFCNLQKTINSFFPPKYATNRINERSEIYAPDSMKIYKYIRENIPEDSIIMESQPRRITFFTGRRSFQCNENLYKYQMADYQISHIDDLDNPKETFDYKERTYFKDANVYLTPVFRTDTQVIYRIEKLQENTNE